MSQSIGERSHDSWAESTGINEIVNSREHLAWLRRAAGEIEKFAMLSIYSAEENSTRMKKARGLHRLSVGLRRMLEAWRIEDGA